MMDLPVYSRLPPWQQADPRDSTISLSEAISHINLRKQNLDHIYGIGLEEQIANEIRDTELERVLEILRRVRL